MKKILITGKDSYIGKSVENWLKASPERYVIDTISVRNDDWKDINFSNYDCIFHVAGIAHFTKDQSKKEIYHKVNTELTFDIAKKAKKESVKQFIFMSSIIVYGDSVLGHKCMIDQDTKPQPNDVYGQSKLNAEIELEKLKSDDFKIAIIRPPMIYGKNSKGNYPKLARLATITPIFPLIKNERSMLHIDNLCEFIKQLINLEKSGLYFPQNREYVCSSFLVKEIAKVHNKNIILTKIFNPLVFLVSKLDIVKKLFGSLTYEQSLSQYDFVYQIRSFEESIELTER